jgi:hypothetical protein
MGAMKRLLLRAAGRWDIVPKTSVYVPAFGSVAFSLDSAHFFSNLYRRFPDQVEQFS